MSPILGIVSSSRRGAPVGAFESIATFTAAGGETSLTFSSIPATYASLQIRGISRDTAAFNFNQELSIRFNSDTAANYAWHYLIGKSNGTTAANGSASATGISTYYSGCCDTATASVYGANIFDIHDYASTTKYKTVRYFSGVDTNTSSAEFGVTLGSGLWQSTSAVTTINIRSLYTAFKAGSTFALYGIKRA
jgi:hypothetical protein